MAEGGSSLPASVQQPSLATAATAATIATAAAAPIAPIDTTPSLRPAAASSASVAAPSTAALATKREFEKTWCTPEPAARRAEGGKGVADSVVWQVIHRLTPGYYAENGLTMGGLNVATHVCRAYVLGLDGNPGKFCNLPIVLTRMPKPNGNLGSYITTKAGDHLAKAHESSQAAADISSRAKTIAHQKQVRAGFTPASCAELVQRQLALTRLSPPHQLHPHSYRSPTSTPLAPHPLTSHPASSVCTKTTF